MSRMSQGRKKTEIRESRGEISIVCCLCCVIFFATFTLPVPMINLIEYNYTEITDKERNNNIIWMLAIIAIDIIVVVVIICLILKKAKSLETKDEIYIYNNDDTDPVSLTLFTQTMGLRIEASFTS